MESILWTLDLLVVVFACRWALRADEAEVKAEAEHKKMGRN
jgi:hypothetical protein